MSIPAAGGVLIVDKPLDWTSHGVVARLRSLARTKRVGHGGTLDPQASGVLVVGIGRATKLLTYFSGQNKTYEATIRLGQSTVTDDAASPVIASAPVAHLNREMVASALAEFSGSIMQRPAAVSAIKVNGQRAYARVRAGEAVELPARPVTVFRIEISDLRSVGDFLEVDIETEVSAGTYIRALARDLGEALGVGGHLTRLRRTASGAFNLAQAHPLTNLEKLSPTELPLVSPLTAISTMMEVAQVDRVNAQDLRHGKQIAVADLEPLAGRADTELPAVLAFACGAELVALAKQRGAAYAPKLVFPAET